MGGGADRWVWLAFLLVLLLSGLIAYVGDTIGRQVGRKRLTIFGLRPKRTAVLVTVLTGMLISGVAMTLLLVASEGARQRILSYNQTIATLQHRIDEQTASRQEAQKRAAQARREVAEAERELAQRGQQLQVARAARRNAEAQLSGAREQSVAAQRQAAATRQQVAAAQQRLAAAQRQVTAARRRLQQAEGELHRAEQILATSRARLTEATAQLQATSADLNQKKAELGGAERMLDNATRVLNDLLAQQRQTRARVDDAEDRLRQTEQELLEARITRDQILADLKRAQMRSDELLESELIARYREELGRSLFRFGATRTQIEDQLETFMRSLERDARARGAAPGADDAVQAAVLPGDDPAAREAYRRNVIEFLAAATARQSFWLRAIAIRNAIKGQPVQYQLRAVPDRIVFLAGAVLGEATMDGRDDEAALARQLEALIRDQVNPRAQSESLLPNLEGSYSRIGPERWLPVLREIQSRGEPVRVQAVAAREIRTGDELDISFRVLPATDG